MAPLTRSAQSPAMPRRRSRTPSHDGSADDGAALRLTYRAHDEDLHPLRSMAERVGKEVERFAENVDNWLKELADRSATPVTKHNATMDLVISLRDEADANVRSLRKKLAQESRGAPDKRLDRVREVDDIFTTVEDDADLAFGTRTTVSALKQWQSEVATWDLLRTLLEHNQLEPGIDHTGNKEASLARMPGLHKFAPETEVWDRFMFEVDTAREKELILRWLEETADETGDDISALVEERSGRGGGTWSQGWLDTKLKLKHEKRLHPWDQYAEMALPNVKRDDTGEPVAFQLDPDAPSRQGRVLEKTDEEYETAVWMALWEMMRRGKPWQEIRDWCSEHSEQWRAVALGKSYDNNDRRTSLRGANVGTLWRRACFAAAQAGQNEYERAVYGLLAGDVASAEPICKSWEDVLYVRLNNILLSQWEQYLHRELSSAVPPTTARLNSPPSALPALDSTPDANGHVIKHLAEHKSTRRESREPMKMIQGALIGKTFETLALNMGFALSKRANKDGRSMLIRAVDREIEEQYLDLAGDYDALRIVVHILLIFRGFGLGYNDSTDREFYENILVGYIDFLRMAGKIELVPLYGSQLSEPRAWRTMGIVSTDIRNFEEQKLQVQLMASYNIDLDEVLQSQFEYALVTSNLESMNRNPVEKYEFLEPIKHNQWPGQRIREAFLPDEVTPEDEMLIRSCEWWMHLPERWHKTFVALTETMKHFLLSGHIGAAVRLIERLPYRHVSKLKTAEMPLINGSIDVMEDEDEAFVTVDAETSLRRSARSSRPTVQQRQSLSPETMAENKVIRESLKSDSRVYYELQQLVQAIKMLDEWRIEEQELINLKATGGPLPPKNKIRGTLESVCDAVQPLLKDFLTHGCDDEEAGQLQHLRRAYLPETILAYNTVLHSAAHMVGRDNITRCMDLATAIAAPESPELANTFVETDRMAELVEAFAHSSLAMVRLTEGTGKEASKKRVREGQTMKLWEVGGGGAADWAEEDRSSGAE